LGPQAGRIWNERANDSWEEKGQECHRKNLQGGENVRRAGSTKGVGVGGTTTSQPTEAVCAGRPRKRCPRISAWLTLKDACQTRINSHGAFKKKGSTYNHGSQVELIGPTR